MDRAVTYSYLDSTRERPIWFTNASSIFPRTTWEDSAVFGLPHATQYDARYRYLSYVGNTDGTTIYYEHETGVNYIKGVVTAIQANILSGDFDITQKRSNTGQAVGTPDLRGDGEYIMRISRFIPDFVLKSNY